MFSENLKKLRESAGLSQKKLAENIGVRPSHIANIESGRIENPTLKTIKALVGGIGCSVGDLLK